MRQPSQPETESGGRVSSPQVDIQCSHRPATPYAGVENNSIGARFARVRQATESLVEPLEVEDFVIQSMPDASPTRWHLAHTTWFFETFILEKAVPAYKRFDADFRVMFNSYYNAVGVIPSRPRRGMLSRPTVREVMAYRRHVNEHMHGWLEGLRPGDPAAAEWLRILEVGLHHEEQHQELIVTDIKHVFGRNPLHPVFANGPEANAVPQAMGWVDVAGGLHEVGYGGSGFCYDNERGLHLVHLNDFQIGDRLVTNREFLEFMEDGGYENPSLWLYDGWNRVSDEGWRGPLYWARRDGSWRYYTLSGFRPVAMDEPVCHVSHYEADAYARWRGARLPTESEWEVAGRGVAVSGHFAESGRFHPRAASGDGLVQMYGDCWEWTGSAYLPYPGFVPLTGALGEYNGKFMSNQMVLRGGSCATPGDHIRLTYRNFFPPHARWQFSGIRLARDVDGS